ncbi:MAG TPA: IPT/TIG domain-containing protein [Bryobacteraceae bacterium]|nr:IPT/TIG domain-containing protein [Bryobacteraceae bacterium]
MSLYLRLACVCSAAGLSLAAQSFSNASLTGKYGFRELVLNAGTTQVQTLLGTITFDGKGAYSYSAQLLSGNSAPASANGTSGTYSVQPSGAAIVSDPLSPGGQINVRVAAGAVLGSNTEASTNSYSLFIAIPPPSSPVSNSALNGTYWVASLEFLNGDPAFARETLFQMTANANGGFGSPSAAGEAINLGNTRLSQTISGAVYSLNADGSGAITLPAVANDPAQVLIGGTKFVYVAGDGSFFIGGGAAAGGQGLLIGLKAASAPAKSILNGIYWSADLYAREGTYSSFVGSADAVSPGTMTWSKRLAQAGGALDVTTVTNYTVNADGSGTILDNNVAISTNGQVFIGSGLSTLSTDRYELFLGVRAPQISASPSGMFLNPQGVANVFSYAPPGNPIAPGEFITIFGSGLPVRNAASVPFPANLNGVQLTINNTPAPLYAITATQVFAVVPYSVSGPTASIVLTNNGTTSNTIVVPVAATSPGVASQTQNGLGAGAITHADGTLVTSLAPAVRGETVVLYLTGLGAVSPPVPDGVAAPSKTLSKTTSVQTIYLNGDCPNSPNCDASNIVYQGLTPGYAGLYQVNFTIPLTAAAGGAVPLAIQTTNGFADMVTIAIE